MQSLDSNLLLCGLQRRVLLQFGRFKKKNYDDALSTAVILFVTNMFRRFRPIRKFMEKLYGYYIIFFTPTRPEENNIKTIIDGVM